MDLSVSAGGVVSCRQSHNRTVAPYGASLYRPFHAGRGERGRSHDACGYDVRCRCLWRLEQRPSLYTVQTVWASWKYRNEHQSVVLYSTLRSISFVCSTGHPMQRRNHTLIPSDLFLHQSSIMLNGLLNSRRGTHTHQEAQNFAKAFQRNRDIC